MGAALFPPTYPSSRERFRKYLPLIHGRWPEARLAAHRLPGGQDLTIDWIEAGALEKRQQVLVLTTGEHGIEGYVGSGVLQHFMEKFLPRLDPQNTGLLLVHAINPWGMAHRRRANAAGVDLNRNFVPDLALLDPEFNPDGRALAGLFNPRRPVHSYWGASLAFYGRLVYHIARHGVGGIKKALLLGQYRDPQGQHFGGDRIQDETRVMMDLYRAAFRDYDQALHLDMHTGYGPRWQMSLVNSVFEEGNSRAFEARFDYPLVAAANTDEFYELRGDMIDYVYTLRGREFPQKRLYACSFEFGTYGDSTWGLLRSLHAKVLENQAFYHGCRDERTLAQVRRTYLEAYFPQSPAWQRKAIADADRAFEGILRAEGYFA